ncbi:2-C-methyl-D-erythritol 2,4-cyclodiphosphate synthase [Salmonella enterica subsp. enterica]|uniref:2-C-methyl-D-erythritol 2,4-cyclodiphosphate synthase n=1 Tax=Salmonella enterica I TaxID=59201 RepID=A0A3S5DMI6_SALET|nr:2-C-methyl-D-erythritol 2,4-cyclodiphosphate synthase [Salmonella enterica subsp. enterica]
MAISASSSPDTDPAFKGADSRELLREAWRRIQAKGYTLGNVGCHHYCAGAEKCCRIFRKCASLSPKISAAIWDEVNVKATTTEKLGFTGRGRRHCLRSGRVADEGGEMTEFDNLTWLHGKPQGSGLLKANPEDFCGG